MGKLILAGGGDKEQTLSIDKEFANTIDKDKPLLYIPIAMDTDLIPYQSCFEWIQSVFNPLGIDRITMWTEENLGNKSIEDLKSFSAIYIGGGNTFSLLKKLRDFNFSKVLKAYIENGGIIYGGSAGAIILGEDIGTCSHMDSNEVNLKDLNGLGLAEGYSLWCHYSSEKDEMIHNYVSQTGNSVIALPEETALFVVSGQLQVFGTKPAYIFEANRKKTLEAE